jgi:hypothetical protein
VGVRRALAPAEGTGVKASDLALAARVYTILAQSDAPLPVGVIRDRLFLERWRGSWWFARGVSGSRIWGALRLLRASGLVGRSDGGWVVRRRVRAPGLTTAPRPLPPALLLREIRRARPRYFECSP